MANEIVKLDLVDRKILTELDSNCRISAAQLAKKVRKSREAVKYRIKKLEEQGVITGYLTSINPNKFGYQMFKVYLQLENIPEERAKFYELLRTRKSVYWYGLSDGAFDCVFAVISPSIAQYYEEINGICAKFERLIIRKVLGTMVDTRQYNKRFLLPQAPVQEVVFGGQTTERALDALDGKILDILANEARIPMTELAQRTGSGIEVLRRRIRKMEEDGIILSYRVALDLSKLGCVFFKAIVYFKSLTRKEEARLAQWMRQNPHSVYYIRSLAPWEAELEFVVDNYAQFNGIVNELRETFPGVIRNCENLVLVEEKWMPGYRELQKQKK